MNKIILWSERTSPLLYIDYYIAALLLVLVLNYFEVNPLAFYGPLIVGIGFYFEAKSMYHELTETHIYTREGLFDREYEETALEDILGFMILQTPFFKFLGLGTVLMVTDPNSNLQPCIKCVRNPDKLLRMIKRQAIKCGADLEQ